MKTFLLMLSFLVFGAVAHAADFDSACRSAGGRMVSYSSSPFYDPSHTRVSNRDFCQIQLGNSYTTTGSASQRRFTMLEDAKLEGMRAACRELGQSLLVTTTLDWTGVCGSWGALTMTTYIGAFCYSWPTAYVQ